MNMTYRLILLALAFLMVIPGCRVDPPPPEEQVAEYPAPEETVPVAPVDPAEFAGPSPADVEAIRQHTLNVADVQRYGRAAESVHEVVTRDPELQRLRGVLEAEIADAQSIEEAMRILEQNPQLRQAIERAGLSTQDYLVTAAALYGAYSYVMMREQGVPEPFRPDYVTDAHIQFIVENRAEVEAVVERLIEVYGDDFDDLQ
jgi:thioredoxin-like negative regulator of GroEL